MMDAPSIEGLVAGRPVLFIVLLGALAILPFALIMLTSFVKISVVLAIARAAIGVQQIPPSPVLTGLALILTAHVMAPVAAEIRRAAEPGLERRSRAGPPLSDVDLVLELARCARGPITEFLQSHAHPRDLRLFVTLSRRLQKDEQDPAPERRDLAVLVPAFVISELREAFEIGFVVFVPFVVIDMIVANILLALGMQMLSPTTISLPFKLLLFVAIDGWHLLSRSLVLGYVS